MRTTIVLFVLCLFVSPASSQEVPVGDVVRYPWWSYVQPSQMTPVGLDILDPEILEGDPETIELFVRFDNVSPDGDITGVFAIRSPLPLTARVTLPTDEFATMTYGLILLEDESGRVKLYKPGDSWFLRAGTTITVTHLTPEVQHTIYWVPE